MDTAEIPLPAAPPAPASSGSDAKLDAVLGALNAIASQLAGQVQAPATTVTAPQPAAAMAPPAAGMATLARPIAPDPEPVPVKQDATPHPDESFTPGEFAYYSYHRNGDPEGVLRTQLVAVIRQSESHVHGLVLGDARDLAQFSVGTLTHEPPADGQ